MVVETMVPRTRRTILVGAFGGVAAWAASAAGRPQPALGHDPDDVLLGGTSTATSTTRIENTENST
ncbi:MAG: hypothetical protein WCK58_18180, partial [Chloroflexota bacterium]